MITVSTKKETWELISNLYGFSIYELDKESSERAGYNVYRAKDFNYYVCDLNTRLEINTPTYSKNIYIGESDTANKNESFDCVEVKLTKKEADYIPYIMNAYKANRIKNNTLSDELRQILDDVSKKVFYAYLDKFEEK